MRELAFAVMFIIGLLLAILLCASMVNKLFSTNASKSVTLQSYAEQCYFEGQKDAIEGDERIQKKNGVWVWIKSPWDNGKTTVFDPSKELVKER